MNKIVGKTDFDAFMSYNTDKSARKTGVALAVVMEKDKNGTNRETLKVINISQLSFCEKLSMWWNESLNKKRIGKYLSQNVEEWGKDNIGANKELQLKFEKQCAKLSRKIAFYHKYQWNLEINLKTSDTSKPNEKTMTYTFDRETSNKELLMFFGNQQYSFKHCKQADFEIKERFDAIFAHKAFSGDFSGESEGYFLKDTDEGKDRTTTITYSELKQRKLARAAIRARNNDIGAQGLGWILAGTLLLPFTFGATSLWIAFGISDVLTAGQSCCSRHRSL